MTDEQKKARRKSAEEGNIRWIKDNCIRTKDGNEDYVFISYKSDDYVKVLDEILYNTCKKYGLRVYFDTNFDENSDSWITQYYENMKSTHCKAFIAFIDDAYYSSYACLLEMMSRKTMAAGGDYKEDTLFFLPINIGRITEKVDEGNTGLGTRRFSDGTINMHYQLELQQFNE
ncbi:MAG: toll/interleukin-1 receptor domain-containing protein, partial [Butyrivibrio sp.]|nr:toll/interleukin-1 receptor domain-containing protein [Butyrivibrio sp.]